jgi:PAS domain S-box-containing protein
VIERSLDGSVEPAMEPPSLEPHEADRSDGVRSIALGKIVVLGGGLLLIAWWAGAEATFTVGSMALGLGFVAFTVAVLALLTMGERRLQAARRSITELAQRSVAQRVLLERHELLTAEHAVQARRTEGLGGVLDATGDAIVTVEESTRRIVSWNLAAEHLLGWSLEAIQREGLPPGILSAYRSIMVSGERTAEVEVTRRDGTPITMEVSFSRWYDGASARVTAVARDLTERKQIEHARREAEARVRSIVDGAGYALIATDVQGRIKEFNPAAERLLGYRREDVVDRLAPELLPDRVELEAHASTLGVTGIGPFEVMIASARQAWERGEQVVEQEWTYRHRDGSVLPVLMSVSALKNDAGEVTGFLGIASSLARRREVEAAMRRAKELAESTVRVRSEFFARMSHEIRTPMNGVLGMIELVLERELASSQREHIETARGSAMDLLRLIDDILDFSQMEAGKFRLEPAPFRIRQCVGTALRALAGSAHDKGLELSFDVDPDVPDSVTGDAARLRQVVTNLLANAIKFTERGEVAVGLRCKSRDAETASIEITVRDTGIGISAAAAERLFGSFEQVHAPDGRFGGSGLGLAVSKQIVERMGGDIGVKSTSGVGSTFRVHLELPIAHLPVRVPMSGVAGRRAWVSVVGKARRTAIARMLEGWGVIVVTSDEEGLPRSGRDDLVVMEPEPGSASVQAEALHRSRTPGILLVWDREPRPPQEFSQVVYLPKPPTPAALLDALEQILCGKIQQRSSGAWPVPNRQLRVLVAEDNSVNRLVFTRMLEQLGHQAEMAHEGHSALSLATSGTYDAILMDVQMPGLDGLEVTRRLRALNITTPIIAVSAQASPEDRALCLAAGMNDHVAKPIEPRLLVEALDRATSPRIGGQPRLTLAQVTPIRPPAPIDRAELLGRFGGDVAVVNEVLGLLLDSAPSLMDSLRTAVAQRDHVATAAAAHSLRGALATIGAGGAAEIAASLEHAARNGQSLEAAALMERSVRDVLTAASRMRAAG